MNRMEREPRGLGSDREERRGGEGEIRFERKLRGLGFAEMAKGRAMLF